MHQPPFSAPPAPRPAPTHPPTPHRELPGWDLPPLPPALGGEGEGALGAGPGPSAAAAAAAAACWLPAAVEPLLPPGPTPTRGPPGPGQAAPPAPGEAAAGPRLQPSPSPPVRVLCEIPCRWEPPLGGGGFASRSLAGHWGAGLRRQAGSQALRMCAGLVCGPFRPASQTVGSEFRWGGVAVRPPARPPCSLLTGFFPASQTVGSECCGAPPANRLQGGACRWPDHPTPLASSGTHARTYHHRSAACCRSWLPPSPPCLPAAAAASPRMHAGRSRRRRRASGSLTWARTLQGSCGSRHVQGVHQLALALHAIT